MDLQKLKRNPKEYNGWNFDYKTISVISQLTKDTDDPVCMEEVESVLLALEKYLIMENTEQVTIPKSAKETLYNSLMQSWQKIDWYNHEEKQNHILIAESYGLHELVKYFNETIDE